MQKHIFDNICLHQNCVNTNRAFYNYWESFSQHESHQTMMIHPQVITQAFRLTQNSRKQQKLEENIQEIVRRSIKQMLSNLEQNIYGVLFEKDVLKYNQNVTIYNKSDIKMLYQLLRKGDNHLLQAYLNFNKSTEKDIYSFIQTQSNQIKKRLQNILKRTRNIIETIVKKNIIEKELINNGQQNFNSHLSNFNNLQQQQQGIKPSSIKRQEEIFEQFINQSEQFIQQVQSQSKEQQHQNEVPQFQAFRKKNKRKIIKKLKEKEQKKIKEKNFEIIGNKSVILQQIYFELLEQNLINNVYNLNATEVHIFNKHLTTRKALQMIMDSFKNLKYVSFNCRFLFFKQYLSQSFIQRFAKISVSWKWNFQFFFKQYYSKIFFTGIDPLQRQTVVTQQQSNLSKILSKSQQSISLWVYYCSMITSSKKQKYIHQGIKQLSIICQVNQKKLNLFNDLKDLEVVVLKGIIFSFQKYAKNKQIGHLIMNNPKIHTFILQQVKLSNYILKGVMQQLATLKQLKRLSLASSCKVQIDANILCKFKNLTSIVLNNLTFKKYNPVQSIQLHQLQFLSLNECKNTNTAFLATLFTQNRKTIKYLFFNSCPGLTDENLDIIKPLQRLEELGFFQIKVTGKKIIEILGEMKSHFYFDLPLKYLGVDKKYKTSEYPIFTLADMSELAQVVPNLKRLSIDNQVQAHFFDFTKFNHLEQLIYLQAEAESKTVKKVGKTS